MLILNQFFMNISKINVLLTKSQHLLTKFNVKASRSIFGLDEITVGQQELTFGQQKVYF